MNNLLTAIGHSTRPTNPNRSKHRVESSTRQRGFMVAVRRRMVHQTPRIERKTMREMNYWNATLISSEPDEGVARIVEYWAIPVRHYDDIQLAKLGKFLRNMDITELYHGRTAYVRLDRICAGSNKTAGVAWKPLAKSIENRRLYESGKHLRECNVKSGKESKYNLWERLAFLENTGKRATARQILAYLQGQDNPDKVNEEMGFHQLLRDAQEARGAGFPDSKPDIRKIQLARDIDQLFAYEKEFANVINAFPDKDYEGKQELPMAAAIKYLTTTVPIHVPNSEGTFVKPDENGNMVEEQWKQESGMKRFVPDGFEFGTVGEMYQCVSYFIGQEIHWRRQALGIIPHTPLDHVGPDGEIVNGYLRSSGIDATLDSRNIDGIRPVSSVDAKWWEPLEQRENAAEPKILEIGTDKYGMPKDELSVAMGTIFAKKD